MDVALFFAGLVLLLLGSTGIGALLARGRPPAVLVAAIILAPVLFLALVVGVQIATEPLDVLGPAFLAGEYGIVLAAAAGLVLGGLRLASRGRHEPAQV